MQTQLITIARTIRDWQLSRKYSDAEICRLYKDLGSTKTYKNIIEGKTGELQIERWIIQYEQVWNLIGIESSTKSIDEPTYDDLPPVTRVRLAVEVALEERGNNRLVIVEGPSGSGKTTAAIEMAKRFGVKIVLSEADETWKESLSNMLGGLLRSLGVKTPPNGSEARKIQLLEKLRETPRCLIIDEAHHLGPRTLNLVKTILNQTPSQVVFLAIPTLLRRLESSAFEEARQLTNNRLCERVRLEGCDVASVEKFLKRRITFEGDIAHACAKLLADRAGQYGNWNFVNLVTRQVRMTCGQDEVDSATFAKAVQQASNSR